MERRRGGEGSSLTTDLHVEATYRLTEALVEAENRMRRRVELLTEVVFETDADGRLVFLNEAWTATVGQPVAACLGKPLLSFLHEADRTGCEHILAGPGARPGEPRPLVRLPRPDGTVSWAEVSVSPIPGGGAVGALHDVTARKQAQDELAKLSLVASTTDNLVIITDRDGCIEWVNRAFMRKTGWTLDEIRGRKPGAILQGPDTDQETVRRIGRRLRERRSFDAELLNYTRTGEPYWVRFHVTPIKDATGAVERFISIQTDSTELHRTQQELRTAKERAESASEAKTQFLATMSHEMRTPLNAILGSSDLALTTDGVPADLRRHLVRIGDSAEALQRLISDLLDMSKIEAGQIDLEPVPVDLRACLRTALAPITDTARAKGLDVRLLIDDALPATVLADPDRLRQVITNLAENAVKFTDAGVVRVEVVRLAADAADSDAAADQRAERLEIAVIDTGPGIPADAQERIFDRFEQGDGSTTRRKGGAGLGLNIVKSLVAALGGTVRVHSQVGAGADFRFTLPLVPVPDAVPVAAVAERVAPGGVEGVAGVTDTTDAPRILVAEDNDANFEVLAIYLARGGYHVERAHDGREAVAAAARADLVLMDVEMPGMDGLEATRRIRAIERVRSAPTMPIIALTAHALEEFRQRCLTAGCTGYLSKPVRMPKLLEAVGSALDVAGRGSGGAVLRQAIAVEPDVPVTRDVPAAADANVVAVDPDFLRLVPGFLDGCRRDAATVRAAVVRAMVDEGAWEEIVRIGHTLKGAGPTLGFLAMGEHGRAIEMAAKARDGAAVMIAVEALVRDVATVRVVAAEPEPAVATTR